MGMQRDLRMKKLLLMKISSSEFGTMVINPTFSHIISYISDHKSCKRCYVVLKQIPCLRVLFPVRNKSGRNGQGILLLHNDKDLYSEVLL